MARILLLVALAFGGWQATQATAPPAKPADSKPATPQTPPAPKPGSIDLMVTGPAGALLADATVRAEGPSSRQGTTGQDGHVVLSNLNAGTYRCRIERDGYITLEKEVVVKAATKSGTEAALTAAPPPPPPPAPVAPPPAAMPVLKPGPPVVVSLTDQMADDLVKSKDPIAEHSLGCSGATSAKLIRVKDVLPAHTHADADEVIYLITGDATLQMGGKDSMVGAGWMGLVPRGTSHTLTRRGTKVVLMLSVQSGPACAVMSAASDK